MARRFAHWPLTLSLAVALGCGGRTLGDSSLTDSAQGGTSAAGQVGRSGGTPNASGGQRSGGGSAAGRGGADSSCTELVELYAMPPQIELLTDTSLSMSRALEGTMRPRWHFVRDALIQSLQRLPSDYSVGIACYPNIQLSAGSPVCYLPTDTLPIAELTDAQLERAIAALSAKQLFGATPTEDAYAYALERLGLATKGRYASRYVVLTSDGAPTYGKDCAGTGLSPVDTAPLIHAVELARRRGVRTFVVGVGPAAESAWMSELALAGGTAPSDCMPGGARFCHYQLQGESDPAAALDAAYAQIERETFSCVFVPRDQHVALREPAASTKLWRIARSGEQTSENLDCATIDLATNTLEVCREVCTLLARGASRLRLEQPCR